jgi:hypothetical protein
MQVETVKYFHGFLNKNIDVRLIYWGHLLNRKLLKYRHL